jgi:hypothetical protein
LEYLSGMACHWRVSISGTKKAGVWRGSREEWVAAYVEHLDVVEDVVVEGKVIAGDDVDTGILLDLPVLTTKTLTLGEKVISRQLAAPVSLVGLLEVSQASHTGETQNRRLNHNG